MNNQQLGTYVADRLKAGLSQAEIKQQLLAVGWSEDDINAAYVSGLVATGIPVPDKAQAYGTTNKSSTVEIVLNFFSFILLASTATALGTLFFQIINKYFPDPVASRYSDASGISSGIHYSIAALIVGFPLYYASMKLWFKKFHEETRKVESRLTKWLTYLVLLITAVTIVGDLIAVIFRLLQGEITTRFFLKTLVILFIAGVIFGFYFLERRKIQYNLDVPANTFRMIGWVVIAVTVIGIVLGFLAGGTPALQRQLNLDEQRANDLREIAGCISNYAQSYKRLPTTLVDLEKGPNSYCIARQDPETHQDYDYRVTTASQVNGSVKEGEFELCANFTLAAEGNNSQNMYIYGDKWSEHGIGKNCDRETVVLEDARLVPTVPAKP